MNKKISFITIFDNSNFGTYLQTLALGVVLEKLGAVVEVIHYERQEWQNVEVLKKRMRETNTIRAFARFLRFIKPYLQKKKEQSFVAKYLKVTKFYHSYDELKNDPPQADIYLTGSDQVWNTIHNRGVEKAFYLDFVPDGKPKYSYAASIGMDEIPSEYRSQTFELLSKYDYISVREKKSVNILTDLGLKNVKLVLDPTILLEKSDWVKYAKPIKNRQPYILVYSVESKERENVISEIATEIAQQKGWDIYGVYYDGSERRIKCCDKNFYYASLDTFLGLFVNSSFVVVSSFHGTVFSILMEKDFITVSPDRFSSRIDSLLSVTDLEARKVNAFGKEQITKLLQHKINYGEVNRKLLDLKKQSLKFIEDIILK